MYRWANGRWATSGTSSTRAPVASEARYMQVPGPSSGRVLYTVPVRGFRPGGSLGAPSHGITITPDGRRLFVIDVPSSYVHAYAVGSGPPRHLADIPLDHPMTGTEDPCGGD